MFGAARPPGAQADAAIVEFNPVTGTRKRMPNPDTRTELELERLA